MGGPKTPRWRDESEALRAILLDCGLEEHVKWGQQCYVSEGKNIAIIQKMKGFLSLMFFKGALLKDSKGVLKRPGANSNVARRFELVSVQDVLGSRAIIERYVREAIEIEKAGLKVAKPEQPVFADELLAKLERDPAFKAAFEALTPGRQRGYNLYFSAPKGTEARQRRIEKYRQKILAGKGFHDR